MNSAQRGRVAAVESTTLSSVAYDMATQLLRLEFRSGAIYSYLTVPQPIWQQLIEQFGDVPKRHCARVTHLARQGRLQHIAGIQPRQLLPLPIVVVGPDERQRLERSAKS